MRVAEYPLQQLHWVIRQDPWVRAIFLAAGIKLDELADRILDVSTFEDSEAMMLRSLTLWERLLGITPEEDDTIDQRRGAVRAMWLASLPPSIATIQAVCDAWRAGEIEASYEADIGTVILTYLQSYGPQRLTGLLRPLDAVKPAHLALRHDWRYRKVKELHRAVSVAELDTAPLKEFAGGSGMPDRSRGTGILDFGLTLIVRQKSRIRVEDQRYRLRILSGGPDYEAPELTPIGDGLWEAGGVLTMAADGNVTVRDDRKTLYITSKEG